MPLLSAQISAKRGLKTDRRNSHLWCLKTKKKLGNNEGGKRPHTWKFLGLVADNNQSEKPLKPQPIIIHLSPDIFALWYETNKMLLFQK